MLTKRSNRFFYADERNADGSQKGMQLDGDAHADFFFSARQWRGRSAVACDICQRAGLYEVLGDEVWRHVIRHRTQPASHLE